MPNSIEFNPYDISSATYKASETTGYTSSALAEIFRVTENWNASTLKWENKPTYDNELQSTFPINGSAIYPFNVTNMAINWAKYEFSNGTEGYPNYGFLLKERSENTYYRTFGSGDSAYYRSVAIIEYENIDRYAPDDIKELSISKEDGVSGSGTGKIMVGWNETVDNPSWHASGIQKYELSLYKADGSLVGSVAEIPYHNNPATSNVTYPGETWDYEYEFSNIPDNTTYYCRIRACDNAVDINGDPNYNWSGSTKSDSVTLSNSAPISLTIDTIGWTNNTTPQITWSNVNAGVSGTVDIQYQINNGNWIDSGWTGTSGSGIFTESVFVADGEYQIKIRGKVDVTNTETGETETFLSAESEAVIYERDASSPIVDISSPGSAFQFGNNIEIKGSVLDGGSGINSWLLEYESNTNPGVWTTITTGDTELDENTVVASWDTSALVIGFYTLRLKAIDNDGNNSDSTYSVTVEKVNNSTPITPTNVKTTLVTDTNYSAQISWEDNQNSQGILYNVYRSLDENFTQSTLVATDVTETYWIDTDILYGQRYYYRVTAKTLSQESAMTTNLAVAKLDKMLGLQDFWKYSSFRTGSGNGYINVANGNFVYNAVDSVYPGMLLAMVMRRTYNSQSSTISALGYGWDFSYNTCLYEEKNSSNDLLGMILKDGDGSRHYFAYDDVNNVYTAPDGIFMELKFNSTTGEHAIIRKDNISYTFGDDLKLVKMSEPNGNYIEFQYDLDGKLTNVENNIGDQVMFTYYQQSDSNAPFYTDDGAHIGLLAQMTDPAGKNYIYTYQTGETILKTASLGTTSYKETYIYADGTYQLSKVKDAKSNITLITYNSSEGKVVKTTFPDDEYYDINYITGKTTLTDSWSNCTEYEYDTHGCVTSIINPMGDETEYIYNGNLQVTGLSYENDINGSLSTISYSIDYDDGEAGETNTGNVISVTDPYGTTTKYIGYNKYNQALKVQAQNQDGSVVHSETKYEYEDGETGEADNGNIKKSIDAEGNVTEYTYNSYGLIETVTSYTGEGYLQTPKIGTITQYTYYTDNTSTHRTGWLKEIHQGSTTNTLTKISEITKYDSQGNPTETVDALGNVSKAVYNDFGYPTKTYLTDGTQNDTDWTDNKYTAIEYDLNHNIKSTTDIAGTVTNIEYDSMDRPIKTTVAVPGESNIISEVEYSEYTYNSTTCRKVISTDPEGRQSVEYYDELGRLIKTALTYQGIEKNIVLYEYDKVGNMITITDADGVVVRAEYDKLNRQVKSIQDPTGTDPALEIYTISKQYNFAGQVIVDTDAKGKSTLYDYDKLGRLSSVTQNDGTQDLITRYTYDDLKSYTDSNGITKNYVVNSIIDARDRAKETYLDEFGRAAVEINQGIITTDEKMVVENSYDDNGQRTAVRNADGQIDNYTYDCWGQVTLVEYGQQDAANSIVNKTKYTYNDNGQMKAMVDTRVDNTIAVPGTLATVRTTWSYDTLGRVTGTVQDGNAIGYTYNKVGQLTSVSYPTESDEYGTLDAGYRYNGYGQLSEITQLKYKKDTSTPEEDDYIQIENTLRDYTYRDSGRVKFTYDYLKFHNGYTTEYIKTKYEYDSYGRVFEIKYRDQADILKEKYTYEYNKNGLINKEILENYYDTSTTVTNIYNYDSLSRLIKTIEGTRTTTYTYNKVGDRKTENDGVNNLVYSYGEFSELTKTTKNGSDHISYTYNDRGGQETQNEVVDWGTRTTDYNYDAAGNLQSTVIHRNGGGTKTTAHFYNGMEQRIRLIDEGHITKFYYSGTSVLFTTSESNAKITENILDLNGQIITSKRFEGDYADKYYFYNHDIRGSVTSIVDKNFVSMQNYTYDDFGKATLTGDSTFINEVKFTGAVSDSTGLYCMNARFYNPSTGRFLTQDTYKGNAWEPWSQNLYTYCGNNPINYIDPTGHNPVEALKWLGAGWGAALLEPFVFGEAVMAVATVVVVGYVAVDYAIETTKSTITNVYAFGDTLGRSLSQSMDKAMEREEGDFDKIEKHHIVPQNARLAQPSRTIITNAGISVQSEQNKVALSYGFHRVLHNALYYEGVNQVMNKARDIGIITGKEDEVVAFALQGLKAILKTADELIKATIK